ncbi:MAG: hypothetical protein AAF990_27390 [Bacteroidota bacterium]
MVFIAFKVNQDALTKKYCINADAPELKCKGKCFLTLQIQTAYEGSNAPVPLQKIEEPSKINYLSLDAFLYPVEPHYYKANTLFPPRVWKSRLYSNPPFQPPTVDC